MVVVARKSLPADSSCPPSPHRVVWMACISVSADVRLNSGLSEECASALKVYTAYDCVLQWKECKMAMGQLNAAGLTSSSILEVSRQIIFLVFQFSEAG